VWIKLQPADSDTDKYSDISGKRSDIMKIGRHFTVYGRVQGVGFRYQTFYWAKRHNVTGFVRNRQDGSVEIEAYGDESVLDGMTAWLEAGGPPGAKVTEIIATPCDYRDVTLFRVRHE
jgi:acylphosphatase